MATETEVQKMWKFAYAAPESQDVPKVTVGLGNTKLLRVGVQSILPKGGETNMHSHPALDSCWMVLKGRAKFYGFGDVLVAEAGPNEGVFIPKGVPYWFEAAGDEKLEILHINAMDPNFRNERVDYAPPVERQRERQRNRQGNGGSGEDREERFGRARPPTEEELRAAARSV
jgi:mannose-6-phosphate isomerase-like protein (cupin superfamily)